MSFVKKVWKGHNEGGHFGDRPVMISNTEAFQAFR